MTIGVNACSSLYVSPELVTGCTPPPAPGEPVIGPLQDPIKGEEDEWKDGMFSSSSELIFRG